MRITANQVTMARIFLLPVPVYMLIYGDAMEWWLAFVIFVLLGATDFVDGLMARKEGPTRLGSLIDPVADKIFMAAIILSMVAIGLYPAWVSSLLLSRELLMTALRSSVAIRKEAIKTSVLAKLKTIIQMGGSGTIFFAIALSEKIFICVTLALSVPFLLVGVIYLLKMKRPPFWSFPVFLAFVAVAVVEYFFGKDVNLVLQMGLILLITWASAIDYLFGSYRLFRRTGMLLGDWSRLFWAIVFGVFVVPLVAYFPITVLPVLVSISLEFGLGGIDNIVVLEKERFSSWPFFLSGTAGLIFALVVNLSIVWPNPSLPFYFSLALAAASSIICGTVFGRHVDLFKRNLL
ncbi:MAG TPA: CDP-alcohol phosphatidyltransferase family protein [Myxococcota bacterium]|nr:CDP-alcohol phosphatidyltransferase family protein [Myxococcota bacterium]